MSDHDSAPMPPREMMPRHTTPTWEMELLISGATVFALMQLPAALDSIFLGLAPRFDRAQSAMILMPYLYVKSAAYVLIATFILHLGTRGYWVALVGLRSVHPDGVRWDQLKWGPNYLASIRERVPSMDALVERADNRASKVFGYGIGFAVLMLAPIAIVIVTATLAHFVHRALGPDYQWLHIWNALFALLFVPFFVATLIDRFFGKRMEAGGRVARTLRSMFRGYVAAGFSSFTSFPILLFLSRIGARRGGVVIFAGILLVIALSFLQIFFQGGASIGSYDYLDPVEQGDERTLVPEYYADQRSQGSSLSPLPYISSETVSGDYLRLFIPFRPTRDNPALAEHCPQAAQPAQERAPGVVLDCLALLYPLALDGVTIADPRFDRAQDPVTGLRGVVAMIRVAALVPGRHLLEVSRPPPFPRDPGEKAERPYRIPFWR
jgi:hypothetical protein